MPFTYDLTTARGKVRLLIPDTDQTTYDLQDAEVDYFLDRVADSVDAAAVLACQWLARKYAKLATFSADGLSIQHGQRAEMYAKRAAELKADLLGGVQTVGLERDDAWHDNAGDLATEYSSKVIYIKW